MQVWPLDTVSSSDAADDPPFHEILRSHRVLAGLTQQALADLSKISPRAIRDLEAGRANARNQTIHLLADGLGLNGVVRETFVHAGLGNKPMAPLGADVPAVPNPVNPLLGRDKEVRAMAEALGSGRSRMISISGLAGAGKTRVAAEVAARLNARHGWPVLWVGRTRTRSRFDISLSPLLRSLHSLVESTGDVSRVHRFIRGHEALLVLDAIADVKEPVCVTELLAYCPGLRVISTSRIPWPVEGLPSTVISPLATPDREGDAEQLSLDDLVRVPSARLFIDRLSQVRPGFELSLANARAAADICRRLDGLPLALETAARQFRVLSLHEIAETPTADLLDLTVTPVSGREPETIASLLSWSFNRQDRARRALLWKLAPLEKALTATDVARLLHRPLDAVVRDLTILIGCGLVRASHGESATALHIPNLLRAFLRRLPVTVTNAVLTYSQEISP